MPKYASPVVLIGIEPSAAQIDGGYGRECVVQVILA